MRTYASRRLELELGLEPGAARLGARLEALVVRRDPVVEHLPAPAAVADDHRVDVADAADLLEQRLGLCGRVAPAEDEVELLVDPAGGDARRSRRADGKRAPSASTSAG